MIVRLTRLGLRMLDEGTIEMKVSLLVRGSRRGGNGPDKMPLRGGVDTNVYGHSTDTA
jgi:hypothetical protein